MEMNENLKWTIYFGSICDNTVKRLASFSWQTGCINEVWKSIGNTRYKWEKLWGKCFWGCTINLREQSTRRSNHLQKVSEVEKKRVGQTPAKNSFGDGFLQAQWVFVNVSCKRSFKMSFSVNSFVFEFREKKLSYHSVFQLPGIFINFFLNI